MIKTLILKLSDNLIIALISLGGVILTAFVTFLIAKKGNYANNVTKERSIWLQHFREEIAKVTAGMYAMSTFTYDDESKGTRLTLISEAEGARCSIITRLREFPVDGNEYNMKLKELLNSIDFYDYKQNSQDTKKLVKDILFYSNKILEREWDKVKGE